MPLTVRNAARVMNEEGSARQDHGLHRGADVAMIRTDPARGARILRAISIGRILLSGAEGDASRPTGGGASDLDRHRRLVRASSCLTLLRRPGPG